jgi:hypothetical protein
MNNHLKLMFNFIFPNKTDICIEVESVDSRILDYSNVLLCQTKDGFLFKKDLYFHLTDASCIIPIKIKKEINIAIYKCNLKFQSDEKRKKFLNRFRKNLIEFSKSRVFIGSDLGHNFDRIVMFEKYWFVY